MGMNVDLARRVRDYARGQGRAAVNVSSAWLAREFDVDPRTVAAALRPYGIRPAVVEPGVRGYVVAELAAIRFDDDPVQYCAICNQPVDPSVPRCHPVGALLDWPMIPLSSLLTAAEKALVRSAGADLDSLVVGLRPDPDNDQLLPPGEGWGDADVANHWTADTDRLRTAFDMPERPAGSRQSVDAAEFGDILRAEADAIERLSAGAGHDMTPALRAAGLL